MAMVKVEGLTRHYGRRTALQDVSFEIERGRIVGVLGLNGAGKSTLLRILAGLLLPTGGRAEVDGLDVVEAPAAARARIGFLPEEPPLYREMTVEDFLRFTGRLKGMRRAEVERRIPEVCARTGLSTSDRRRIIDELSHGYRKRVGIAQAVLHDPALVILDEPISGLDPRQIVDMRATIAALGGEHTVLVSSHILGEIQQTCDHLLLFHGGRLVAEGTEEALTSSLSRGTRLALVLVGEEAEARAVLEAQDGAVLHELVRDGEVLRARVALARPVEGLVAALVRRGVGVRRVSEERSELEQIFLDLTRREEHAA